MRGTRHGTGLVVSGNCLRAVRAALHDQFDHTTLIVVDDPQRELFELLADQGVIDLRIVHDTGMEASAWVFDLVERIVGPATSGRVWVSRINARESTNSVITLTVASVEAGVARPFN